MASSKLQRQCFLLAHATRSANDLPAITSNRHDY
jgi:hypothetical protein